jgi:hypothetical protein
MNVLGTRPKQKCGKRKAEAVNYGISRFGFRKKGYVLAFALLTAPLATK